MHTVNSLSEKKAILCQARIFHVDLGPETQVHYPVLLAASDLISQPIHQIHILGNTGVSVMTVLKSGLFKSVDSHRI